MDEEVIYLLNRFPRYKRLLMELYSNNNDFKALSQDYYNAAITLEKFDHNIMKGVKGRAEHEKIYSDLENSIRSYLKSSKKAGEKTSPVKITD